MALSVAQQTALTLVLESTLSPDGLLDQLAGLTAALDTAIVSSIEAQAAQAENENVARRYKEKARLIADVNAAIVELRSVNDCRSLIAAYQNHNILFRRSFWGIADIVLATTDRDAAEKVSCVHGELKDAFAAAQALASEEDILSAFERTPLLRAPEFHQWLALRHEYAASIGDKSASIMASVREVTVYYTSLFDRLSATNDKTQRVEMPIPPAMSEAWAFTNRVLGAEHDALARQIATPSDLWTTVASLRRNTGTADECMFMITHFAEHALRIVPRELVRDVLNVYQQACVMTASSVDIQSTCALRYANAVIRYWRLAGFAYDQLRSTATAAASARSQLGASKRARLLRDLDFAEARLLENMAIWKPEMLHSAAQAYTRGLSLESVKHEGEARGRALGDLANTMAALSRRGDKCPPDHEIEQIYSNALAALPASSGLSRAIVLNNYAVFLLETSAEHDSRKPERALELADAAIQLTSGKTSGEPWMADALASMHLTRANALRARSYGSYIDRLQAARTALGDGYACATEGSELKGIIRLNQAFLASEFGGATGTPVDEQVFYSLLEAEGLLANLPTWSEIAAFARATLTPGQASAEDVAAAQAAIATLHEQGAMLEVARREVHLASIIARGSVADKSHAKSLLSNAIEKFSKLGDAARVASTSRQLAIMLLDELQSENAWGASAEVLLDAERLLMVAARYADEAFGAAGSIEERLEVGNLATVHAELGWVRAQRGCPIEEFIVDIVLSKNREVIEHTRPLLLPHGPRADAARRARRKARHEEMALWEAQAEASPTQSINPATAVTREALAEAHDVEALALGPYVAPTASTIIQSLTAFLAAGMRRAALDFTVTRWGTIVLCVDSNGLRVCSNNLRTLDLRTQADTPVGRWHRRHRAWVESGLLERAASEDDFRSATLELLAYFGVELAGAASLLADPNVHLTLVPGALSGLPLHALPLDEMRLDGVKSVTERRLVDVVDSLSFATSLLAMPGTEAPWGRPDTTVCFFSDPGERQRLQSSRGEVRFIASALNGRGATVRLAATIGSKAGLEAVPELADVAAVASGHATTELLSTMLPVADHFVYSGHGSSDGLLLAGPDGQPRLTTIPELLGLDLSARRPFVHLSACSSAEEATVGGDTLSVVSCFLRIGARSVLGGLWPVSDAASARLSELLYGSLVEGSSLCEAFLSALRQLRSEVGDHDILRWAPFVWFVGPA